MTIAVVGASGFVGSSLVERLLDAGQSQVRPFIHRTGNAGRLARRDLPLRQLDLLAREEIHAALEGCVAVVNCARGPSEVMLDGLRNLLDASRAVGVRRFVHLSSVAAFGDVPTSRIVTEDARAELRPYSYGWIKAEQDKLVDRASNRGLSSVILCPPVISGAYSPVLLNYVAAMEKGAFALVDGGTMPCNLVDIENLIHAIRLALETERANGKRLFVTDDEETTWADLVAGLGPLAEVDGVPHLSRHQAEQQLGSDGPPPLSVKRALKHLVSADVRAALKKEPLFDRLERSAKTTFRKMPAAVQSFIGSGLREPRTWRATRRSPYSELILRQQLRNARYSCEQARIELGYRPLVTFSESMRAFTAFYRTLCGWQEEGWSLLTHLPRATAKE
jgi:nucleoside-diphosphate-sugar epimerase